MLKLDCSCPDIIFRSSIIQNDTRLNIPCSVVNFIALTHAWKSIYEAQLLTTIKLCLIISLSAHLFFGLPKLAMEAFRKLSIWCFANKENFCNLI